MGEIDTHLSLSVLRLIVFLVALLGNSLILFVVLRSRRLRKNSSNLLLAQLAFADLFLGLAAGTRGTSNIIFASLGMTEYDKALCLYLGMPTNFGIHISQTTVLAISLDRFLCVKFPILYRRVESVKFAAIRFLVCLSYSVAGVAGAYIGVNLDSQKIPVCSSGVVMTSWYLVYFQVFSTVFSMLIYVFYATIYILFKRQTQNSFGNSQRTLFVTMTAILVSYFLLFGLPTTVNTVTGFLKAPKSFTNYLSAFTGFLSTLTSVANIFIYGWKHPEVRRHLKATFRMKTVTVVEPLTRTKTRDLSEIEKCGRRLEVSETSILECSQSLWSFFSELLLPIVELHDAERSMRLKLTELEPLDYCEQPDDDVLQLDTENDQRGSVAVEHLYKKIREVYGQPPRDLRHKFIDFGEDVVFKAKRPSPYDFPAFEHEKLLNEANDRMRLSQETMTREERRAWLAKSSAGLVSKEVVKSKETKEIPKAESKEKGQAGVEVTARSDGNSKSKMKSKGAESKNQAPPKVSHNEALDHCSLEDE